MMEERQKKIEQLRNYPDVLSKKISSLSEKQLDIPVRNGEWTVRQIVHHVADAHLNGYIRMKLVLTENKPILKPYDQDLWADLKDSEGPIQSSMQILVGIHERWANLLSPLSEADWAREGIHLENGLVNLDKLLDTYVNHGQVHLEQIDQLNKS
jgi:hypothetical protein